MIEAPFTIEAADIQFRNWSQQLQRRVMRLLLQHGEPLFRNQFGQFFAQSALPQIPLLQQYDRYIKLHILSNELLDDILPRIRRQLSLKTSQARLHEEAPTRGDIDWQRTIEHNSSLSPGLPALQFDTRLRQRSMETPENLLTVAILLAYRQELREAMKDRFVDEDLSAQEMQTLISADERAERELAAPYARALAEQAHKADINALAQEVAMHLRPGPSPYRSLIEWWRRFANFRVGRAMSEHLQSLASKRTDEKIDAWLYELWIALEYIHLLYQEGAIRPQDMEIATDLLQCTFTWQQRRFRFIYNRQLDTSTTYEADWEHGPSTRLDYTIEREKPLEVRHEGTLIWREPPVVLDAKYYLDGSDPTNTHGPIKKLLGDMTLLGTGAGALFFPQIPEPPEGLHITRTIRRTGKQYYPGDETEQQIHLYHLEPAMPFDDLQKRLRSTLDLAARLLPERPAPACIGTWLDPDTVNASHHMLPPHTLLCPKPHIGQNVFDLVNVDTDCLKNPRLCHVIGQPIVAPFVVRVTTAEQLTQQSSMLRTRSDELLYQVEQMEDEAQAERLRAYIFAGVGRTVEQYVKTFGNTASIEEHFEWVFGAYWQQHSRSLEKGVRNSLVSGEFVWQHYQGVSLHDWAAPAIQYCRALEHELKRRLYQPCLEEYHRISSSFTIGSITNAYLARSGKDPKKARDANAIWDLFVSLVRRSGSDIEEFEGIVQSIVTGQLREKRNMLAHGEAISKETASRLRESVIGTPYRSGILLWLAEHLDPA